ncbi:uncharacterized protein LOC130824390 isoform X1 [Amaranthus tricolor]|uniref:uncharacterized protein LOC130824390 isoform X1 n=1 Tax=Amaranthus tricolor TaxID=29722 RepID=UPI00258DE8FD|nr:uncharacterized protein LOC130824390 isoform X1 [Amaranthus tricolor]
MVTLSKIMVLRRLLVFSFLLLTIHAISAKSKNNLEFKWQTLSSANFSSQIRIHPHVLLFVTVPWCGESRSLMDELSKKLAIEQEKYSSLKLMLVNRNVENRLADSLGAVEGLTVLCYHHAVSYKYKGIFRVQNILSSMYYLISNSVENIPLKRLGNSDELEMFLASTDKAVLLLETCGWTSKFLKQTGNETVQALQESLFPGNSNRGTNQTLASKMQKDLKDVENDMNFDVQHGYGGSPWVGEFSAENVTESPANEVMQSTVGTSCSFEEYTKFKAFFSKFMAFVRDVYLPPQRQRYGFMSDRSLLLTLGIEDSDQWSLIISYVGCPGCLWNFKDEKYIQNALEMRDLPVMELPDAGEGFGPALPIDKPSVILFVDRASDSVETRNKSQKALHAFKEVALQFWNSSPIGRQSGDWPKRSFHSYKGFPGIYKNHRLLLSPSPQIKSKDKMSIMIINEGKQITLGNEASNLQGGSLHEILTYLVGQKKQARLSSLAKEAGFQLLSDDLDIKIADVLSSHEESLNQDSATKLDEVPEESIDEKITDLRDDLAVDMNQQIQSTNIEAPFEYSNGEASIDSASKHSGIVDPEKSANDHEIMYSLNKDLRMETDADNDASDGLRHHFNAFNGSFFFSDGNYKFLRSLVINSEVPRLVIVDPLTQQHYVLTEEATYNVNSVMTFINKFLNGSLVPYQRAGPLQTSMEMPQPPFVNLDFREKDSIPCVTADTFSELVLGSSESNVQNATNAWHKDVIVIFSNSWCGFCQRMELIVREVHRALKGYIDMVESEPRHKEIFSQDDLKDVISKLPAFYSIDCTLNDCSWILKSIGQREVYPILVLFPAERKTAIVYDGNMMVADILKFISNHGSKSHNLAKLKGTLWTEFLEKEKHNENFRAAFKSVDSDVNDKYFGTIAQNAEEQKPVIKLEEQAALRDVTFGSFLIATELLSELNPFFKARILIVGAVHDVGFQGLIINKPINSWNLLPQFHDAKLLEAAHVSFGGPVIHQEMPLVSLTKISFNDQHPQVLPGVYFLDQLETLNKIKEIKAGNLSATDLWFFWGYSGWSWDQLFSEIDEGLWIVDEGNDKYLQW